MVIVGGIEVAALYCKALKYMGTLERNGLTLFHAKVLKPKIF